ncbi:MAG: IS4 family transposase, partial [Bacteroidales bacterium]|nr:IS4 family transposase [Bacteroidales bacterium]
SLGKMVHLGIKKAPSRSTLAYANEHRPWQLYEKLFYHLLNICRQQMNCQHKFRFKNRLLSFDASVIDLCLSIYDWAQFRRTKGAIKLHLLLDHAGYLPEFVNITTGKVHEVNVLKTLSFKPGAIIVFDRGLVDYMQWGAWTSQGVYFVTRLKSNADYKVVKTNPITVGKHILNDQIIKLNGFYSQKNCPYYLRLVEKYDPETGEILTFVTNQMKLAASTIAAIYKERWQIECFFKAIKQNLRIKTFVGTSFNAVMIQIWTALIAILILKYLQAKSKMNWSLSNLVAMLRMNLLTYKNLWEWINHPYFKPPAKQKVVQQCLAL